MLSSAGPSLPTPMIAGVAAKSDSPLSSGSQHCSIRANSGQPAGRRTIFSAFSYGGRLRNGSRSAGIHRLIMQSRIASSPGPRLPYTRLLYIRFWSPLGVESSPLCSVADIPGRSGCCWGSLLRPRRRMPRAAVCLLVSFTNATAALWRARRRPWRTTLGDSRIPWRGLRWPLLWPR